MVYAGTKGLEQLTSVSGSRLKTAFVVAGIGALAFLFLWSVPALAISEDGVKTIVIAAIFVLIVCGMLALYRSQNPRSLAATSFFVWWYLLISEALFDHMGDTVRTLESQFSAAAYGEGVIWILVFIAVLVLTLKAPGYIGQLLRSSSKWISLFALVCVVSAFYSPSQLYALAWSFKLVVVVLLLQLCASTLRTLEDVILFMRFTMWGFFILATYQVVTALVSLQGTWKSDRLDINPTGLSPIAACLLLLGVVMYSLEHRRLFVFASVVGAIIMFLAFGKTAIIAGVLSTVLFYGMQRKLGLVLVVVAGMVAFGAAIVSLTPLSSYLDVYNKTGQAYTFTGRTDVWAAAMPAIRSHLLLGHGYLASYFTWTFTSSALGKAGHLHNSFLEVAYNNGIVGVFLLAIIQYVILRNIILSVRRASILNRVRPAEPQHKRAYLLSIGCVAIYFNLLIGGMFEPSFGGRALSSFTLLLAVFVVSDFLQKSLAARLQQPAPQPEFRVMQPTF